MNDKLMGVFAPITTPFTADGTVDYSGLEHNVRAYAKSGLKGFLALGSNGENKSLTNEEKLKVLEIICTCKREDQVVMAGCIFESTFETIEMAHRMEAYHPDFLTLLPPHYFKKQMTDDIPAAILRMWRRPFTPHAWSTTRRSMPAVWACPSRSSSGSPSIPISWA